MDKSIELSKEIYNSGNIVDGAFFYQLRTDLRKIII